jgi:cytochrome b561
VAWAWLRFHAALRGFVALALTTPRLAARLVSFSSALASPRWEPSLAAVTQGSLYVLTLCAILSSWLVVSTSHLRVPTRFFDLFLIPNIAQLGPVGFSDAALLIGSPPGEWLS